MLGSGRRRRETFLKLKLTFAAGKENQNINKHENRIS